MLPGLESVAHRPWPLPAGPWVMVQIWHDLLFAHWPIAHAALRPLVPPQLLLDTWEGECWVGVVPFWMSGVRARGMPAIPGLSQFPELNVRTYVTHGGKPGVYFFSLDAGSHLAVWGARAVYHLPYFYAEMNAGNVVGEIEYRSSRRGAPAEFRGRYAPSTPMKLRSPGTLEHWLTEKYCLYTVHRGSLYRGEIHHALGRCRMLRPKSTRTPWPAPQEFGFPTKNHCCTFRNCNVCSSGLCEKYSPTRSAGILPAVASASRARRRARPFDFAKGRLPPDSRRDGGPTTTRECQSRQSLTNPLHSSSLASESLTHYAGRVSPCGQQAPCTSTTSCSSNCSRSL